jgi:ABC-2 type transport system ATP-binding protein
MIKAENLTKYYGRRKVVREVSFEVERGEIVGLLGPNGAGKTTTMRMITGYLNASGGRAVVAGFDVSENPLEVRKRLGYLPETVPLYNDMTVQAYLDFTAKLRGVPSRDRRRRIAEVIDMCRISDVAGRVIGKLSRGYRQRVGLAQAIVHNPDVIILDEPTVGLDPRQIIEIRHVIRNLAGNHSMILSTHILQEVNTLCARVIIINQGRVLVDDTLSNLERQGQESERLQLEVRGNSGLILHTLQGLPGITQVNLNQKDDVEPGTINRYTVDGEPGGDPREAIVSALTANGFGLLELKTAVPTLEEIFVKIITEDLPIEDEFETKNQQEEDLDESEEEEDEELDDAPAVSKNGIKQAPSFLSENEDGELVEPDSSDKRDSDRKK